MLEIIERFLRKIPRRSDGMPSAMRAPDEMGEYVLALREIDAAAIKAGVASHTTPRFRWELLYFLLDNPTRGPIMEVGTMNGGMTALFGYVAAVTGRQVFAIDLMAEQIRITTETCKKFGVGKYVSPFTGTLEQFLNSGALAVRPDLVFIDADHSYNSTLAELKALYGQPLVPRCTAMHDFNYRQGHQIPWLADKATRNPIAVDHAVFDYFAHSNLEPTFKRLGAFSGDGTVGTRTSRGGLGSEGDFVEDFGTEGMMIFTP
jgi:hypothetical protein